MDDARELLDRYIQRLLGRSLAKAQRGDLMDAYRKTALRFNVSDSTVRMWRTRGVLPRHVRRQIQAMLEERTLPETAVEDLDFDPAVLALARDIQKIHDLTGGRGEVWRSLAATVQLAMTWIRHRRPKGAGHLSPLPRP